MNNHLFALLVDLNYPYYPQIIFSPGAKLSFVRLPPHTGQNIADGATEAPHLGHTHPTLPVVSITLPLSTIQSKFSAILFYFILFFM